MTNFDELDRAVREAIKAGRVGQPVFVRCLATVAADADRLGLLARVVQSAREWIDAPVRRVYVVESPAPAQTSVSVEFASGATALFSTLAPGAAGPAIDVIVLGNHGAVYHEALAANEPADTRPVHVPGERDVDPDLRSVLERAVRSARPESPRGGGMP